jgi:hypothetical protein
LGALEIHKPKPWHGLREFLKEYLVIVVGVLTALAAEQAVEWFHWRHVAHQAETQLAAGLRLNLTNSAEWLIYRPCSDQRVTQLAEALGQRGLAWKANPWRWADADTRAATPMPTVLVTPNFLWGHVDWEAALASGAINHLPRDQVAKYAEIYRLVEVLRETQKQSLEASAELAPLGYDGELSGAQRTEFLSKLGRAESLHQRMFNASKQVLMDAQAVGLQLDPKTLDALHDREARILGPCSTKLRLPIT